MDASYCLVMKRRDFLDEIISERSRKNPMFPSLVAAAEQRRKYARDLVRKRTKLGLSQTLVAAKMGTAASVVSKLEAGGDVKISTFQKYCAVLGEAFLPR